MNLLLAMGSMPAHPMFPDCSADFRLGLMCGVVLGFAVATFFWIVIHYLSRR